MRHENGEDRVVGDLTAANAQLRQSAREQLTGGLSGPLSRVAWTVDVGFVTLLIVCSLRYFSIHAFPGRGQAVLALAVVTGVAYLISCVGRPSQVRGRAALCAATVLWVPLVLLAPSFGWTAFALFFAVHRVLPRGVAQAFSGVLVLTVSLGLYELSDGQDLGFVLGPLLGGLVLSICFFRLEQAMESRRKLIAELLDTQAQLARVERDAGALTERNRVAGELHDTSVQRTVSALILLEAADTEEEHVAEAREVLRKALVETRQLMHGLTRSRAEEGALSVQLSQLAVDRGASFLLVGDERVLSDELSHALLRVCQESLMNIAKHAQATRSRVTLTFFPDSVGVDIADNGVGFEARAAAAAELSDESAQGGFGLRAMQWRVENLGGTFTLETAPGSGTVVAAVLPEGDATLEEEDRR